MEREGKGRDWESDIVILVGYKVSPYHLCPGSASSAFVVVECHRHSSTATLVIRCPLTPLIDGANSNCIDT